MHKASILSIAAVALVGSIAIAAPFKVTPTFTDNGTTLSVSGSLAGLGAGDLEVTLEASGTETVVCGGSEGADPPQPKPILLTGTKIVNVPLGEKAAPTFDDLVSAAPLPPPCPGAGSDPVGSAGVGSDTVNSDPVGGDPVNGDGNVVQHDVSFTSATIAIRPVQTDPLKPPLKPVRCIQCSFKAPTVDGPAHPQSCFTMSSC